MLDDITPLIITHNEAPNIGRTLSRLAWARQIVVVDSGSTDGTHEILEANAKVSVHTHKFETFATQCNFGLGFIKTPWVLSLDADYILSQELIEELRGLHPDACTAGYRVKFTYAVHGRNLRGSLYPPRITLYRLNRSRYVDEGHGHRVNVDGPISDLAGRIFHDDRKDIGRWFSSQQKYARQERDYIMLDRVGREVAMADKIRRVGWPAPFLAFLYTLFIKGCLFDGRAGWHYALQRLIAESMLALELTDQRLRK